MKRVAVVGLGLIGGSLALDIKNVLGYHLVGIDGNQTNAERALELGLVDEIADLSKVADVDIVIVATPVNTIASIASQILDLVGPDTWVFDVGSVKEKICKELNDHAKRDQFLAAHPIAGTEFSGPDAALEKLFNNKTMILCDVEKTKKTFFTEACSIFAALGMELKIMKSKSHDKHIAYVSHLSHVSSFMLGKTVLEIEKDEQNIFDLAGSGFESTVRLAKSSPNTWTPIFEGNKKYILTSLDEYIKNLIEFKELLSNDESDKMHQIMEDTNHLKEVLKGINKKQQHLK